MKIAAFIRRAALAAVLIALASPRTPGQELLKQEFGSAPNDRFGISIAAGGPDLDGDGFAEIAVGAMVGGSSGTDGFGSATVLSGRDFTPIHTILGTIPGALLGSSLAWCDDLDGDGLSDLVVGLVGAGGGSHLPGAGRVRIYSTGTWLQLRQYIGQKLAGRFGTAVSKLRDVDGDGVADLLVGAPREVSAPGSIGTVYVYSGASGSMIRSLAMSGTADFGDFVADVGDVNNDGVNDIGVGAPTSHSTSSYYPYAGLAFVFSGADGSLIWEWQGSSKMYYRYYPYYHGNYVGTSLGAAGDVDGDGTPDVWVSSRYGLPILTTPAFVVIYSGATGAAIRTLNGLDRDDMTNSVGDLDGDGIVDFVAGGLLSFGSTFTQAVSLLSGADGREFWRGEHPAGNEQWGAALAATQDVNLDGHPEIAVSAPNDGTAGYDAGRVDFLGSSDLWLDIQRSHFPTAGDVLTLTAAEGTTGNLVGLFLTAVNGIPTFSMLAVTTFDANRQARWTGKVPAGYAGNSFAVRAIGAGGSGRIVDTTSETIEIQ